MSQDVDALRSGILGRDPGDNAAERERERVRGGGGEREREREREGPTEAGSRPHKCHGVFSLRALLLLLLLPPPPLPPALPPRVLQSCTPLSFRRQNRRRPIAFTCFVIYDVYFRHVLSREETIDKSDYTIGQGSIETETYFHPRPRAVPVQTERIREVLMEF